MDTEKTKEITEDTQGVSEETKKIAEERLREEGENAALEEVAAAYVGAAGEETAGGDVIAPPVSVYVPRRRGKFSLGVYLFIKRAFDIVSAGLLLVVLSPLILLCLAIKWIEDGANPIYVSERVGKDGKIFHFYKIRSMCPDADKMKDQLIAEGKNEADGPAFKMKDDPRITPFGKFLRRTSIDELPQLLNIVKGDMSVVGPRPPLPREVKEYTAYQMHRLDVRGGLLCTWQITPNRNGVTFDEWVRLDLEYIDNRSVWLDLKIIFKAVFAVLKGNGAE